MVYVFADYRDDNLRTLLLEALDTFGNLNENIINDIVAIFHFLGKADAGEIRLSQSDVSSLKWEANIADLKDEGLVSMEQNAYREYFLVEKKISTKKYRDYLDELKRTSHIERRKLAIYFYNEYLKNSGKSLKFKPDELQKILLDMRGKSSTTT